MVTCGSHVGNREFQPLETGISLPWTKHNILVPVLYQSITQNPKSAEKLFLYHSDMHLFRAKKHFYGGPAAERKHSATGPVSKTKVLLPAQ